MRRIGSCLSTMVGGAFFALLFALFVGPAVSVEVAGKSLVAVISAKREPIDVRYGIWSRQLWIEARIGPLQTLANDAVADAGGAQIAVEPALYDKLRVGQTVAVRYVAVPILSPLRNTGFARLDEQPPLGALLASLHPLLGIVAGIALWLALLAAWSRWRQGWLAAILVIYMVGASLYVGSNWPPPEPGGPREPITATVRDLHHVDRVWGGEDSTPEEAVQPFEIVELEYVPAGAAGPVIGVDLVDSGSTPGLQQGARLPIHYSVADHRWAQLDTASRTYYWKNLRTFGIIAVVLVALLAFAWVSARKRAVRRASVTP